MTFLSDRQTAESLALFSVVVLSVVTLWKRQEGRRPTASHRGVDQAQHHSSKNDVDDDLVYLQRAHQLRLALDPPPQSNFRVVALLLLQDNAAAAAAANNNNNNKTTRMIWGTNDEPSPNISLAMCAERAALLQYRLQQETRIIETVYIVTDADDKPVPPGTACREYLQGHAATRPETRIVLQSSNPHSKPWILTLDELYPFPCIYNGMSAQEQVEFGAQHEADIEVQLGTLHVPKGMFSDQVFRLMEAAHQACLKSSCSGGDTDDDVLHPVRYGAAMAMAVKKRGSSSSHVEILQAAQIQALEYSSTQDAICQLLASHIIMEKNQKQSSHVLAVVQVDQFGIPHAPFAQARSFLVEQGFEDCQVILTIEDLTDTYVNKHEKDGPRLSVRTVVARELAPFLPHFR